MAATKKQVKEAIKGAVERGPRNEEELLEYAVLELKGEKWVNEHTDEDWNREAYAIAAVAKELGLDIPTGQHTPKQPKAKGAAKAEPKPRAEPSLHPCICGCGEQVSGRYRQGHDAKVHSWIAQVEKGEMTEAEFAAKGVDASTFVPCSCCGRLVDPHSSGKGPACRVGRCACARP